MIDSATGEVVGIGARLASQLYIDPEARVFHRDFTQALLDFALEFFRGSNSVLMKLGRGLKIFAASGLQLGGKPALSFIRALDLREAFLRSGQLLQGGGDRSAGLALQPR